MLGADPSSAASPCLLRLMMSSPPVPFLEVMQPTSVASTSLLPLFLHFLLIYPLSIARVPFLRGSF